MSPEPLTVPRLAAQLAVPENRVRRWIESARYALPRLGSDMLADSHAIHVIGDAIIGAARGSGRYQTIPRPLEHYLRAIAFIRGAGEPGDWCTNAHTVIALHMAHHYAGPGDWCIWSISRTEPTWHRITELHFTSSLPHTVAAFLSNRSLLWNAAEVSKAATYRRPSPLVPAR